MKDVQVEEIPSATVENHRVSIMREKLRDLENRFWRPGVQTMEARRRKSCGWKRGYSEAAIGGMFSLNAEKGRKKDSSLKGLAGQIQD